MTKTTFREAIKQALDEELALDDTVVVIGEDVARAGGAFQVTRGLWEKYGESRVFDTPISELAIAGCGFGAAVAGLRPVIEIMFGDFIGLAADSLINQSAKYEMFSNGRATVPLVVRTTVGGGGRFGAIHSQNPGPWFLNVPGIKIVAPGSVADAKGLLKSSIRDDGPVIFLEHKGLYNVKTDEPLGEEPVPLGRAATVRTGGDVTIVAAQRTVAIALEAASRLEQDGVEAEVIDLRTIKPLDVATLVSSVDRTGSLVTVEEAPRTGGWSAEVVAAVADAGVGPTHVRRVAMPDAPLPYSPPLEDAMLPNAEQIVHAVTEKGR